MELMYLTVNKLAIGCIIVLTALLLAVAPSCANAVFEISNLTISPQEVESGQSATISVDITNAGGTEGTYPVILKIDGVQIDEQNVTVGPATTQQASFTIAKEETGSYTVGVSGLTATLKVLKPAEFKVEALTVSPTEVVAGTSITVTVDVTNIGEVEGDCQVTLRVNGEVTETKKVTITAGDTETVSFTLLKEAGSYIVDVEGLTATLKVLKPAEFKMGTLIVPPSEVAAGTSITVTVDVTNIGEVEGDCQVTLRVNGEVTETKKVTITAGDTETVSFTLLREEAGTYSLSVNGLGGSLTVEYPAPSIYYRMGNIHEVAVRPDGKELYMYGLETPFILIVDIDSPGYPVVGAIPLPGRKPAPIPYISFSQDSAYAYISRAFQCEYEESCANFSDFNQIIVVDTAKREIDRAIPMPSPYSPTASVVSSPDARWLYFTAADFPAKRLGIGKLNLESQKVVVDFLPLEDVNFITLSGDGKHIYATQGWNLFGPAENLFCVIDAESFQIVSSVPAGDGPRYVAVTPDGQKAYVSNRWSNDVSVIDLQAMEVIATINVGAEPRVIAITPDGRKAYVAIPGEAGGMEGHQFGNTVAVIDVKTDVLLDTIEIQGGLEPESIAMDPDGTRAYVSDGNANGTNPSEVHVIDTVNDVYLRPIILRAAAHYVPTAIAVTPDGQKLFVVSEVLEDRENPTSLLVIDATTGATLDELDIQPRGVKVSADGTRVYAFSPQKLFVINSDSLEIEKYIDIQDVDPQGSSFFQQDAFRIVLNRAEDTAYLLGRSAEVIVVDMTRGEVAARIPFAEGPIYHERGLALTPDESKLFVSDYRSRTVAVIDTSSNTVVARVPVANLPSEIRISQDGKRAYVLQQHSTTLMTIIDVETHAVLKSIDFPSMIAAARDFEMSLDERYVYIACFDHNFVMVYDLQEDGMAKIIDVGLDPFNMVSTPDKRFIYITNFTSDDISVIDTTTNTIIKTIKLGGSTD